MKAQEIYNKLVELRDRAGGLIYDRLKMADALLSDREWVVAPEFGGGDEGKAIDRLEANCFADLCGVLSLPQMLEIIHHCPSAATWQKNKFNLRKMHQEMKDKLRTTRPKSGPTETPGGVHNVLDKDRIIELLRQEVADLRKENAKLHLSVKKMRKWLKAMPV